MTPDQRLLANVIGFLAGVALLIGLGGWVGYAVRDNAAKAEIAECNRAAAEAVAAALRTARQAEADYRAREALTTRKQQEAIDAAHHETRAALADRDRVRLLLERLRNAQRAAPGGGDAAPGSAAAGASAPTGIPDHLPADLLGRIGLAAAELAEHADAARIAGRACERAYDAVTTPQLGGGE
jgi:hypothetical protein